MPSCSCYRRVDLHKCPDLCCFCVARSRSDRPDDKPKSKTLILCRDELTTRLSDDGARERARVAVSRLLDIKEIRNGRLHTEATTWAACLGRLGITPSDPPDQQWEGVRAMAVDGLYTIIEVLEQHIS
jgi:hypothetical protein